MSEAAARIPLLAAADVPVNGSLAVRVEDVCLLVCNADDVFYVVENRCTHQNSPLEGGRIRRGYVSCPLHGARFNLATGEPLGTLTRTPIRIYPAEVVDGFVMVTLGAAGATR
jgi:3-phenylpropionate/trans-cinnamate dioxygenase ferredoxin component